MPMEKRKAHYALDLLKMTVREHGIDAFTRTAVCGLHAMGLSEVEGVSVVLGLQPDMLHKSMTTHADSRVWQDVYLAPCPNGKTAYVKLTLRAGTVVIQFKEK
jgi:motility quorum-sensing regulator / GCU-specific mRNA interferase toxin